MRAWMIGIVAGVVLGHGNAAGVSRSSLDGPATLLATELARGPSIAIRREESRLSISFTGVLQSADAARGPWSDVPNATSPLVVVADSGRRFYRTREVDSIFASRSVVTFRLTGPFQHYFDLAFAGTPDGIFPPHREKPYFEGGLRIDGADIPVSLRVRGNSSLQECPFPKLKFKVSREHRAGTAFAEVREIKIGTHCAEGGRGPIGRLRDQTAAFREALAYETISQLGFVGPQVRRARLIYQDTTVTNDGVGGGWELSREAVILEDVEVVAERLGGRALDDAEVAALTDARFDAQGLVDLEFLHALLGNWDYALSSQGRELRNTEVIELGDGQLLPVAGDFDLASWVTGVVRLSAPWDYLPELPDLDRQARYELERIRKRVDAPRFRAAQSRFMSQRGALEAQIGAAQVDEPGRSNAVRHVTVFFDALATFQQWTAPAPDGGAEP